MSGGHDHHHDVRHENRRRLTLIAHVTLQVEEAGCGDAANHV